MMRIAKLTFLVPLAAPLLLLAGCATSAIWEDGQFARRHEPASPSNLRLFYSTSSDDYLVEYTEIRDSDGATVQRAYWLLQDSGHRKPRFVDRRTEWGLDPVPVFDSQPSLASQPVSGRYVVASANDYKFTIYQAGNRFGTYALPDYADLSGRVKQVLLTPPAMLADVTIGGGVVAVATFPIWGQLLTCWHP